MDRVSLWFPPSNSSKSKLALCLNQNLPVFAQDVNALGAKSFFCCGYSFFVDHFYKKKKEKRIYEVLRFDKPTKLFFDFDQDIIAADTKQSFEQEFDGFLNGTLGVLASTFDDLNIETIPMVVLDASTTKKLSRHVIIDVLFENMSTVKDFVSFLQLSLVCSSLDAKIYTRNRAFRLIYSEKYGKKNPLIRIGDAADSYNAEAVYQSLIQAVHRPGKALLPVRTFTLPQSKKRRFCEMGSKSTVNTNELPLNLICYIANLGGIIRTASKDDQFIKLVVGQMFCPFKQDFHKNNNAYFTFHFASRRSWWKCADPCCPQIHYDIETNDWIL